LQKVKEYWQNLSDKAKKMLVAIVAGTLAIAIIGVLALNIFKDRSYSTLFTGLNQEEAQEVVSLLQENQIDYTYSDKNGTIRVPSALENQTRGQLLSQGYPKSGFSYDIRLDNAGIMSTESDKKQLTLYELQNRLGAQIRSLNGVKDATVTIVEAESSKYALADESQTDASASVVVTMMDGLELTEGQASAIKRLIQTAVKGMNFDNVSILDAGTGLQVAGSDSNGTYGMAQSVTELTTLVEQNIAANIRRVLEKIYGQGRTAISVKGTLNMEKLIQEETTYTTPEKIDEQDKTGLLYEESVSREGEGAGVAGEGGVVGADANADTPRYTNDTGTGTTTDAYQNYSHTREWLYNSLKEQREISPGVLEGVTVSVVIDTDDMTSVSQANLTSLVANAAGINQNDAQNNITIVRTATADRPVAEPVSGDDVTEGKEKLSMLPFIIAGAIVILLLLVLLLLLLRKRKKAKTAEGLVLDVDEIDQEEAFPGAAKSEAERAALAQDEELEKDAEILNLRMQHSLKLKQNIGEFIDENPQIAAKLVQSWLRGEGDGDGGSNRKQK